MNMNRLDGDSRPQARTQVESSDVEAVFRRLRQIGWALLVTAIVVDAGEVHVRRARTRLAMLPTRITNAIEPRASTIATLAQAFLDGSAGKP